MQTPHKSTPGCAGIILLGVQMRAPSPLQPVKPYPDLGDHMACAHYLVTR